MANVLDPSNLAPEMLIPPTEEGVGPQPLQMPPTGGDMAGNIARALAEFTATSGLARNPQSRQAILGMVQRQRDQIRKKKIATEKQFFTSTLSAAWQSGDPKQIGKVMQQLSKLEGLEPESSEFADQIGLKVAQEVGQAAQEDELAEKLVQAYPEGSPERDAVAGVIQALPGMKPSQVMKILNSPFGGVKPSRQFVKELGGYVVSHGTGFWNPTGKKDEFIPLAGVEPVVKEGAEKTINTNDILAFIASEGKVRGPSIPKNMTVPQATETFNKMATLAGAKAGEVTKERSEALLDQPPPAIELSRHLDKSTLQPPNVATLRDLREGTKSGRFVVVRPEDVNTIHEQADQVDTLIKMRSFAKELLSKHKGKNLINAIKLEVQARGGFEPRAALFSGWSEALTLQLAASFNRGRPSDKDRDAVRGTVFKTTDTVETALSKIEFLVDKFEGNAQRKLGVSILPKSSSNLKKSLLERYSQP